MARDSGEKARAFPPAPGEVGGVVGGSREGQNEVATKLGEGRNRVGAGVGQIGSHKEADLEAAAGAIKSLPPFQTHPVS